MKKQIITIGREYGSGGHEIGEKLSALLGKKLYDKVTLMEKAKQGKNYEEVKSFFQEKPVDSLLYAIAMNTVTRGMESKPFKEIKSIVENEAGILIGCCGDHIFKGREDVLRVFIHAEAPFRRVRVAKEENISIEKAEKRMYQVDKERASFHKFYTQTEWQSLSNYDLVLNSSEFGIDGCIDIIMHSLNMVEEG